MITLLVYLVNDCIWHESQYKELDKRSMCRREETDRESADEIEWHIKKDVWVVKTVLDTLFIHLVLPSSGVMFDYEFQQLQTICLR